MAMLRLSIRRNLVTKKMIISWIKMLIGIPPTIRDDS
jgi:hypothetical protein